MTSLLGIKQQLAAGDIVLLATRNMQFGEAGGALHSAPPLLSRKAARRGQRAQANQAGPAERTRTEHKGVGTTSANNTGATLEKEKEEEELALSLSFSLALERPLTLSVDDCHVGPVVLLHQLYYHLSLEIVRGNNAQKVLEEIFAAQVARGCRVAHLRHIEQLEQVLHLEKSGWILVEFGQFGLVWLVY